MVVINPLADIVAGAGKTGATVELSHLFDTTVSNPQRSIVEFMTNFDTDTETAGLQAGVIRMELFDDLAPLTVQNFLSYVENANTRGDYDDTFFHRSVSNFVLQGGGFETRDFDEHIPVGLEVHNEFDASRSNTRGTIAMAKTGLGPNTATSEFFFNLGNNASNLDNQNGGFTVFGRVISGMDVVDAIAALPTEDLGGALGSLPVQGEVGNQVKPGNLVTITDARVVALPDANTTGITFEVVSVSNPELLTATIGGTNANDLQLQYNLSKSGTTQVTIRATKDGMAAEDTFSVTVKPNLIANVESDGFQSIILPGEGGTAKIELSNSGASTLTGNFNLQVYLSKAGAGDQNGTTLDDNDLLVGEVLNQALSIQGGESTIVSAQVALPQTLLESVGAHRLIVKVTPSAGTTVDQLFTDDDNAIDGSGHALTNQFGTFSIDGFGKRTNQTLTYVEADGDVVKLSVKGKGSGTAFVDGDRVDLLTEGTDLRSTVKASVSGTGKFALDDIELADVAKSIKLGNADVTGFVAATSGVKSITLGNVSGGGTMLLGAFSKAASAKTNLTLGSVNDLNAQSLMPLGKVSAREWLDTGGAHESIVAPSLSSLRITGGDGARGDFGVDVNLVRNATLSTFSVAGLVTGSTIVTQGNVGTVRVGGMQSSSFFAGVSERPDAVEDFATARTIKNFIVAGLAGVSELFVDSQVAAANFGTIEVQGVVASSGDSDFGFVADAIKSYNRLSGPQLTNLDTPGKFDAVGNFSVTVL
jgi:cyclophilin family peptidyl-prolyl cis-trans isomerase